MARELCVSRWNDYYSPLHATIYILDLEFQDKGQENDKEVNKDWMMILDKIVKNCDARHTIRDSLSQYRSFEGTYGCHDAQQDQTPVGELCGGRIWI